MPGNDHRPKKSGAKLHKCEAAVPETMPGRRGRKPDPHARDKVFKAAAAAFMERGYSGTSIDDIANAMGATKGFVYHQYKSKSELYFAVQEAATERIDSLVRSEFDSDARPDKKLQRMGYAHVCAILSDFPAAKVGVQGLERGLMTSAGAPERRNLKRYIRIRDDYEAMFVAVIEAGMADGVFRKGPIGLLSKGVLGALNWVTLWFDPRRPTTQKQIEEIAQTLSVFAVQGVKNERRAGAGEEIVK